jgi:hypothetical protein
MLSGSGESGSGIHKEIGTRNNGKREWTCWVAAHRPKQLEPIQSDNEGSHAVKSDLIVLEFEYETDIINPLTPNARSAEDLSGSPNEREAQVMPSEGDEVPQSIHTRFPSLMGLEGLEQDIPMDKIIDSTTNHARPLRALERMRRVFREQSTNPPSSSDSSGKARPQQPSRFSSV